MSCRDRVLDVFVTKDSKDYEFDDEYIGPVWSVEVEGASGSAVANVVNTDTEWVTWCDARSFDGASSKLDEGDVIRIGNTSSGGYSDYCTVLEKRLCTQLQNAAYNPEVDEFSDIPLRLGGQSTTVLQKAKVFNKETGTVTASINQSALTKTVDWSDPDVFQNDSLVSIESAMDNTKGISRSTLYYVVNRAQKSIQLSLTKGGPAITLEAVDAAAAENTVDLFPRSITPGAAYTSKSFYAYRINFTMNVTKMQTHYLLENLVDDTGSNSVATLRARTKLQFRADPMPGVEQMYYPLYRIKTWLTNSGLVAAKLDHGVKALNWIKLVGYSVFNKRQVGFAHTHEMIGDDWVALHIDEVPGNVVSNNQWANGAFAVLHVGGADDAKAGAVEYHAHDNQGLFCHYFENHNSTVRNLNMKFLDRQGNPAHFGRIHLWFKMCVAHG